MANPQINSVSPPGPLNMTPGQQMTFTVAASDADARTGQATFNVVDAEGNTGAPVTVAITVADPVTITATTTVGTISPDPVVPGRFLLAV
jgi:hypothetical protein